MASIYKQQHYYGTKKISNGLTSRLSFYTNRRLISCPIKSIIGIVSLYWLVRALVSLSLCVDTEKRPEHVDIAVKSARRYVNLAPFKSRRNLFYWVTREQRRLDGLRIWWHRCAKWTMNIVLKFWEYFPRSNRIFVAPLELLQTFMHQKAGNDIISGMDNTSN
jgi:hypothetical protein